METLSQAKWHNYTLETKNPLYSKLYNKRKVMTPDFMDNDRDNYFDSDDFGEDY